MVIEIRKIINIEIIEKTKEISKYVISNVMEEHLSRYITKRNPPTRTFYSY